MLYRRLNPYIFLWKQVIVEIRLHNVGKKLHLFAQHLLISDSKYIIITRMVLLLFSPDVRYLGLDTAFTG